jgi:hypothetical protein
MLNIVIITKIIGTREEPSQDTDKVHELLWQARAEPKARAGRAAARLSALLYIM